MPTTRRRHAITETDAVARALGVAAAQWPADADRPSRLLARLIELGARDLEHEADTDREVRLDVLRRTSGAYTGLYDAAYLRELRAEWPQ